MDEHRFSADLLNFVILSGAFAAKDLCSLVVQKRSLRNAEFSIKVEEGHLVSQNLKEA